MKQLLLIALCVSIPFASEASACSKCGYSSCRLVRSYGKGYSASSFKQQVIVNKTVQPSYVPQTIIFNNSGTAPQVLSQGQTVYGASTYQQAIGPYKTSSADQLHLANRLAGSIEALATQASQQLKSETEVNRLLGASQALATTINAARESTASATQQQSFVVTIGADGQVNMQTITAQAHQAITTGPATGTQPNPNPSPAPNQGTGILSLKCGSCHGPAKPNPDGGISIHDDAAFVKGFSANIQRLIANPSTIPSDGMRQAFESLTPAEQAQLIGSVVLREQ